MHTGSWPNHEGISDLYEAPCLRARGLLSMVDGWILFFARRITRRLDIHTLFQIPRAGHMYTAAYGSNTI
jgi:hypothetical protein